MYYKLFYSAEVFHVPDVFVLMVYFIPNKTLFYSVCYKIVDFLHFIQVNRTKKSASSENDTQPTNNQ